MQTWTDIFREEFIDVFANKNLGQNFLFDPGIITGIVDSADLKKDETVLEIGPGLGSMTAEILSRGAKVICVEYDENLAKELPKNIHKIMKIRKENGLNYSLDFHENLMIESADFLQFDLSKFAKNPYKIIANIPYNITKPIITKIIESDNQPELAALLVQQEVAEKVAADAGGNSVLSLRIQNFSSAVTGIKVSRKMFTPEPKVDSQVLILRPGKNSKIREFYDHNFHENDGLKIEIFAKKFWQIVNAGFANKRKKLRTSLAPAFAKNKDLTAEFLIENDINPDLRAQDLAFETWLKLAQKSTQNH